jgi:hypothetical protein
MRHAVGAAVLRRPPCGLPHHAQPSLVDTFLRTLSIR